MSYILDDKHIVMRPGEVHLFWQPPPPASSGSAVIDRHRQREHERMIARFEAADMYARCAPKEET